jgi:divalent metal cation (Fe/Co/Zn/Cd) transporter
MDGNKTLKETHASITEIELKLKEQYGSNTYVTIHLEPL